MDFKVKSVTLTDAQIKTMPTTAVEIVPAPGAGKLIVLLDGSCVINSTAGAYVADTNSRWQLLLGTKEVTGLAQPEVALVTTPGEYLLAFPELTAVGSGGDDGYLVTSPKDLADRANQPLNIKDDYNGVANYTGGNAANTVKVTVVYVVIDL